MSLTTTTTIIVVAVVVDGVGVEMGMYGWL